MNSIKKHFLEAQSVLNDFLSNDDNFQAIEKAGGLMAEALLRE